jgi:hypothetical protein
VADTPRKPQDESESKRSKFLKLARSRWSQGQEAQREQQKRERDDLEFYAGGLHQWPEEVQKSRRGQEGKNGAPDSPSRPMITINKTREPVRQVLNQERQSDMGIEIVAADDFGDLNDRPDETEITLREGLVRRIQRESQAADARTWAFARAVQAGRGFYGVMTRYAKGKTNDQVIYIHRYYNQACVTLDPAHEQPDGSDAEWGFVGTDMTYDAYTAEFPNRNGKKNRVCNYDDTDWRGDGEQPNDWFSYEGEGDKRVRMCRVVDYWYTVRTTREVVAYQDANESEITLWADEVAPEGYTEIDGSRRDVIEKTIKWAKIDGCDDDVLDETDWPGPDIPIVKVLGEELQPFDKQRRVEGMVRPMREPGQGFNYMISREVEVIALSPLVPVMMAAGQDEGYEDEWNAITTRTIGRVHYNQKDSDDMPAPPPQVSPSQNPPIQAIAVAIDMFDQAIQATSGQHDPSLGKVDPSIKSGRAIHALQEQSARSSNHFLDNLQRSIRYEGQIVNNLLYPIYGRKGRIARILNREGEPEQIILHQPMVTQGKVPMPAHEGQEGAKLYKLTKDAQFNVVIKVSKDQGTRRQQEEQRIGELIQAEPTLMTWFGDLWFKNQDGPGHQEMSDRAKVMLDPKIQQMLASKAQGQDIPPEVQAQLAGAQQQIEQLTQQLQEATAPGAVAQVKAQADLDKAKLDADTKQKIAAAQIEEKHVSNAADNETKLAVAELGALAKQLQDTLAMFAEERARLGVQGHEAGMTAVQQAHEREMAEQGHQQALEQSEQGAQVSAEQAEAQRAHEAEMAEQAQQAPSEA